MSTITLHVFVCDSGIAWKIVSNYFHGNLISVTQCFRNHFPNAIQLGCSEAMFFMAIASSVAVVVLSVSIVGSLCVESFRPEPSQESDAWS